MSTEICSKCKGNGYIKVPDWKIKIIQCLKCDSEGEVYAKNTNESTHDTDAKRLH